MPYVQSLKYAKLLYPVAVCVLLGVFGFSIYKTGYYHGQIHQAEADLADFKNRHYQFVKDVNEEIKASHEKSMAVETQAEQAKKNVETIKEVVVKRVQMKEPMVCKEENSNESNELWTFDGATVRLLNNARRNEAVDTTTSDNATNQTATNITVSKFVENDLDVVAMYHDLAVRHKALQDYVRQQQEQGYQLCKAD